jgi:hypothetical protein
MPGQPSAKDFLTALWQGIDEGFVIGRLLPSGQTVFFRWPHDQETLASWMAVGTEDTSYLGYGIYSVDSPVRGAVKAVSTFWTTVNLGIVSLDRAAEALKRFPAKPSAGFIVKDVLHVFWFLKQPIGPADFDFVWAATQTIIAKLLLGTKLDDTHKDPVLKQANLQAQHFDFDGVFRAPGQADSKFVAWHPEIRYGVEEFTDLLCPKQPETAAPAPAPPKLTGLTIPERDCDRIIRLLAENWFEAGGMTRHLAGMLAHAGIAKAVAKHIVTEACQSGGGDHAKAPGIVDEAYARLEKGETVTGGTTLDKSFDQLPGYAREKAKKALDKVRQLLPRPPGEDEGPEPDFSIKNPIVKFDSRPARWSATLTLQDGRDLETTCETSSFIAFNHFQAAFYEQNNFLLNDITQYRWKRMLAEATIEVKETPPEARPDGAIESALEEFLREAREKPDVGILKTFAGYDEESRYFRMNAFKDFLKDTGHRIEDRVVFDNLKRLKFEPKTKRIGSKTYKVWAKAMEGEQGGNGSPDAKAEEKPKEKPDLFGQEEA